MKKFWNVTVRGLKLAAEAAIFPFRWHATVVRNALNDSLFVGYYLALVFSLCDFIYITLIVQGAILAALWFNLQIALIFWITYFVAEFIINYFINIFSTQNQETVNA